MENKEKALLTAAVLLSALSVMARETAQVVLPKPQNGHLLLRPGNQTDIRYRCGRTYRRESKCTQIPAATPTQ